MKMGLWENNISVVLLGEAVESRTPDGESPVAEHGFVSNGSYYIN